MKSKKILTILLSLAIMFTFMPSMVFAALPTGTTEKWADDGSSYTVTVNGTSQSFDTTRSWSDGIITASVKASTKDPSEYNACEKVAYGVTSGGTLTYQYVDLNNASVVRAGAPAVTEIAYDTAVVSGALNQSAFDVLLTVPSYVTNYDAKTATTTAARSIQVPMAAETNATVVFSSKDLVIGADYTQTATVAAIVKPTTSPYETTLNYYGDIQSKQFTVNGVKTFTFAVDSLTVPKATTGTGTEADPYTFTYDGATHTLVNSNVAGKKIEYDLLDSTTNKWTRVDAVQFKDADTYAVRYRVFDTAANAYDSTAYTYMYFKVVSAGGFWFGIDAGTPNPGENLVDVGDNANPLDYVFCVYSADSTTPIADAEEAMKFFNDKYEIKATPSTADATRVTWQIVKKSGVDLNALAKTYKVFLANNGADNTSLTGVYSSEEVRIGKNSLEDDINFTGVTTKVFSGKKTTKKGKLKKAQTITVKAVADSGNAITFSGTSSNAKISVTSAGKIKIKKGLKKGTYKVKVTAKTAAGNGFKAAKATETYTIKIKK